MSNTSSQVFTPRTSHNTTEVVSKVFPPLIWEVQSVGKLPWPFPVINGERTEASEALLGVRVKPTKDNFEDFEDALW